jgi:hypothetical protein
MDVDSRSSGGVSFSFGLYSISVSRVMAFLAVHTNTAGRKIDVPMRSTSVLKARIAGGSSYNHMLA